MLKELIEREAVSNLYVSERIKVYEASFDFIVNKAPEFKFVIDLFNLVSERDEVRIIFQDENENVLEFNKNSLDESKYKNFISYTLDDEIIRTKIKINKLINMNYFSVYSFEHFTSDILSLSIENVMNAFSDLFKESSGYLIFDVYNDIPTFTTKTMFFISHNHNLITSDFDRNKRIEDCKEVSYFYNFDTYQILPDDFKIDINYINNPLTNLFQKMTVLLSINFIATSSSINDNQLKGIINGQRAIEYSCDLNDIPVNKILYNIYSWIYTGGNAIDKAIIARNVISLHCKYIPIIKLDEKVMASIQSNYNLYLKDNVVQYLELKNKVAEFISEIVSKTGEYATGLLDKFKSNLIAIFGFLFTVILANIVSTQPLNNIFTKEITTLVECVLLGSFIYLIICYLQSCYEMKKVYDSYEQLKKNYLSILTEEDLKEIFEDDEIICKMKKSINKSGEIYLSIWITFLIVSFVILELVSSDPNFLPILNQLKTLIEHGIKSLYKIFLVGH